MLKNKSIKLIFKGVIGFILFSWMAYSLYHQIQRQQNLKSTLYDLYVEWNAQKILLLAAVIVLMVLNWSIEAGKWRLLLKGTEEFSLSRSLQSVLTGVAVSVITPNRIGEYMGRILYLKNVNKIQGITVTIIGSFAQLIITGFLGLSGLIYYISYIKQGNWLTVLLISSVILCASLTYFYFHLYKIIEWTKGITFLRKIRIYLEIVKRFDQKQLLYILFLSFIRYIVYTVQFLLLLQVMMVFAPLADLIFTIWLIFWAMAIVPTIAIAEIGVRGETALYFLLPLSANQLGIVSSSLMLWLINLIIPALIGCLFVYKMKIYEDD
ncbi:MAG: flippase-like domain-containing protein [Bacteroidetes bacterium]|nr:flippase-like domain-containing protein [Bacteroidota bacterium]MBK8145631.1 flippase-like domain-containing protein [Bacteroidota bacterium]MBP6315623.1 flippase-like domain-containing protein [Chitinophagaceae bacterium]